MAWIEPAPAIAAALALLLADLTPGLELIPRPTKPAYVAAPAARPTDTITGWVVDANDWLDMGFVGPAHRQSALTNADLGTPLVILTSGGSIFYPVTLTEPSSAVANNTRLIPFAEERVKVAGRVIRRGGERGIVIASVEESPRKDTDVPRPAAETTTVELIGWVTDLSCWVVRGETGAAFTTGTRDCAEDGEPLVLVDDAGHMYYPVVHVTKTEPPDFTTLIKHIGHKVRVRGKVLTRGTERAIMIDRVEAYAPDRSMETLRPGDSK